MFYMETVSGCPLDPLARQLADSESLEHLDRRIAALFAAVAGNFAEMERSTMCEGLRNLYLIPPVLFREEHWDALVRRPGLCRPRWGGMEVLDLEGFKELMRGAVRRRQVFQASGWADGGRGEAEAGEGGWTVGGVRRVLTALKCRLMLAGERARRAEEGLGGCGCEPTRNLRGDMSGAPCSAVQVDGCPEGSAERAQPGDAQIETCGGSSECCAQAGRPPSGDSGASTRLQAAAGAVAASEAVEGGGEPVLRELSESLGRLTRCGASREQIIAPRHTYRFPSHPTFLCAHLRPLTRSLSCSLPHPSSCPLPSSLAAFPRSPPLLTLLADR